MASDSLQHWVGKNRPPRVQITYDVDTDGAIREKELPFVLGVMGDFSGASKSKLAKLAVREFKDVTPDNFNVLLASMQPYVKYNGKDFDFKSLDDFLPDQVAQKIAPELWELRTMLTEIKNKIRDNELFEEALLTLLQNPLDFSRLQEEVQQSISVKNKA